MKKTNSILGEILSRLMFEAKLKTMDLSRITQIPQPTLHKIATGKSLNPRDATLKKIADYFSISVEQLKGKKPLPQNISVPLLKLPDEDVGNIFLLTQDMLHSNTDLSALPSNISISGNASFRSHCFAIKMPDISMEPLFPKESILIFNSNISPTERQYILVYLKAEKSIMFRQLLIDGNDRYLKALNPDFKLRELHSNDIIKGTLVESRNNFITLPMTLGVAE